MPAPSTILSQCIDAAVAASARLMERCIDQALASLQEAENASTKVAERQDLSEAGRELHKQRGAWTTAFPVELRKALQSTPEHTSAPAPLQAQPGLLTLVDDATLVQSIESSRLSQQLLPVVEQALAELDGLMSTVLGLPAVRPEANPMRPEVFARALRATMGDQPAHPEWPALWTRHMGTTLGRELDQLYRAQTQALTQAKVRAATYRVLPVAPSPSAAPHAGVPAQAAQAQGQGHAQGHGNAQAFHHPGPPAGAWASNDARMRNPSSWADLSQHGLGEPLLQDFLFHGGGESEARLAPGYYARVDQEIAALESGPAAGAPAFDPQAVRQFEHLPAVDRPQRHVATDSPLSDAVWGDYAAPQKRSLVRSQLKKQAKRVGQVMGLEVVRKLVNQVAQDPRLLAPVRESIVALEPALLRLAMVDPRFFGQEQNPARRLVERVAERSFKYNDEFSDEFAGFAEPVAQVFNDLNARTEVEGAEPFESALAGLEASWSAQDAQEEDRREEVVDAVRFAEQRQAEADQIAWGLSQRADLDSVPGVVQDFLFGPWALVMAHARLTDTRKQIDPGGHGSVVSDLLWSVKREVTLRQPGKLIEMIPSLLSQLRDGLAALGQDPQESDTFFKALEKLHRPVLKLRARHRRDTLDSMAAELQAVEAELAAADADDGQPRVAKAKGQLWMGRKELDAAGFEDTLPSDHAELAEDREQDSAPAPVDEAVDAEAVIAGLREGCWVDLYSHRQWLRARLVWASTKGTLYMFTSHGGQPHSMTRRSLERLVRGRLLRPVDAHGVVSHAIDTLRREQPSREPLAA